MSSKASTLKLFRQIHLYFGIFISPAILFFAITGALQTFSLHETTRGSDYKPPVWLMKLGQLHKKSTLVLPVSRPQPPAAAKVDGPVKSLDPQAKTQDSLRTGVGSTSKSPAADRKPKNHLPMKIFFSVVSIGLVSSTFTGIYMA